MSKQRKNNAVIRRALRINFKQKIQIYKITMRGALSFLNKVYNPKILFPLFIIWIIFATIPFGFVPDIFGLERALKNDTYIKVTLSFISVFSFLITILVLSYGFLREKFRRLTLNEFLQNRATNTLVSIFISAFLINIFSAIYLDNRVITNNALNIAYYSLTLSICYFIGFIPLALVSISNSDSQQLIDRQIEKIQLRDFPSYRSHDLEITSNEHNPLNILINLIRVFSSKDDFL